MKKRGPNKGVQGKHYDVGFRMDAKKSKKKKQVWMPHAGHFICGNDCRFHLNTYVNGYIVSTVGELWPDSKVREIKARCAGVVIEGRGDLWDFNYLKKFGFDKLGGNDRTYETMVFKAVKSEEKCCPWKMESASELEAHGYTDAGEAMTGHMKMVNKYGRIK